MSKTISCIIREIAAERELLTTRENDLLEPFQRQANYCFHEFLELFGVDKTELLEGRKYQIPEDMEKPLKNYIYLRDGRLSKREIRQLLSSSCRISLEDLEKMLENLPDNQQEKQEFKKLRKKQDELSAKVRKLFSC